MANTIVPFFEHVLEQRWEEMVDGREQQVPTPKVVAAADVDLRRVRLNAQDHLFVMDGRVDVQAKNVGWTQEQVDAHVTLDMRTAVDRGRLEGVRTDDNARERYGGLRGETKRILDTLRKGEQEFDWIESTEWRNLSEEMGYGFWRGTWEVKLSERARDIDPEP